MIHRTFGESGLTVSLLGLGAGHIGDPAMEEQKVVTLLNGALDLGINLIDTARSYGLSEERIGKHLSGRRKEFILSTKGGYTYRDKPDWSFEATMGTVDEALVKLRTDYIDIFHLHSCDRWVLEKEETILALEKAKEQGKVRVIAYSGENDALSYAIETGRFGSLQCSANLFDQHGIDHQIRMARERGIGIIGKRPLGNAVWRYESRPEGHGHAEYYDRYRIMGLEPAGIPWEELALRFAAYSTGIDCLIAGTSNPDHLVSNLKLLEKGPLPEDLINRIRITYMEHGREWPGLI